MMKDYTYLLAISVQTSLNSINCLTTMIDLLQPTEVNVEDQPPVREFASLAEVRDYDLERCEG